MYIYKLNWETGIAELLHSDEPREEEVVRSEAKSKRINELLWFGIVSMICLSIGVIGAFNNLYEGIMSNHIEYTQQKNFGINGFIVGSDGIRAYFRGKEIELSHEEVVYSEETKAEYEAELERIEKERILEEKVDFFINAGVPLERPLVKHVILTAEEYGIEPAIMFAMAWKESSFTAYIISATNDYGMWQINRCNHVKLGKVFGYSGEEMKSMLMDPYFCIKCSCYMISNIMKAYPNFGYHEILTIYNRGDGGAFKLFNQGIYSSEYSRAIINYAIQNYGYQE